MAGKDNTCVSLGTWRTISLNISLWPCFLSGPITKGGIFPQSVHSLHSAGPASPGLRCEAGMSVNMIPTLNCHRNVIAIGWPVLPAFLFFQEVMTKQPYCDSLSSEFIETLWTYQNTVGLLGSISETEEKLENWFTCKIIKLWLLWKNICPLRNNGIVILNYLWGQGSSSGRKYRGIMAGWCLWHPAHHLTLAGLCFNSGRDMVLLGTLWREGKSRKLFRIFFLSHFLLFYVHWHFTVMKF